MNRPNRADNPLPIGTSPCTETGKHHHYTSTRTIPWLQNKTTVRLCADQTAPQPQDMVILHEDGKRIHIGKFVKSDGFRYLIDDPENCRRIVIAKHVLVVRYIEMPEVKTAKTRATKHRTGPKVAEINSVLADIERLSGGDL
jgi:hypothetical protein